MLLPATEYSHKSIFSSHHYFSIFSMVMFLNVYYLECDIWREHADDYCMYLSNIRDCFVTVCLSVKFTNTETTES